MPGGKNSRILPPTAHYGADKVLFCAVLINFPVAFKDLQQFSLTCMRDKHRNSPCPSHGALANSTLQKLAKGSPT